MAIGNWSGIGLLAGSHDYLIGADGVGSADAMRNIISANRTGIIFGAGNPSPAAYDTAVYGNCIGTNASGTGPLGNATAIFLGLGSHDNQIDDDVAGLGNKIAFSTGFSSAAGPGVRAVDFRGNPTGNSIRGNSIYGNNGLGIDLGGDYPVHGPDGVTLNDASGHSGPNLFQNFPVLSAVIPGAATTVSGTLIGQGNAIYILDFYANAATAPGGYGQGERFIGSAMVNWSSTGNNSFTINGLGATTSGEWITATATDPAGNTSEFSFAVPALSTVVTNSNDDGIGSLRQAILASNQRSGKDTITFDIPVTDSHYNPVTGAFTIRPASALPIITDPVILDGASQPGYAGRPLIELDGNARGVNGLTIIAGNSEVRGLAINNFSGSGIFISSQGTNVVEGCYIGTDATGALAKPNIYGIQINSTPNNRVGTNGDGISDDAEGNVISGNVQAGILIAGLSASGNIVAGNLIGSDSSGTVGFIGHWGVYLLGGASGNRIGTNGDGIADDAERNIISGRLDIGIWIHGAGTNGNVVAGNYIGTDKSGSFHLNNAWGLLIDGSASGNRIGTNSDGIADAA